MSPYYTLFRRFLLVSLLVLSVPALLQAQGIRPQPKWWFGVAGGANFNTYNGTAQILNDTLTTPAPFHKGSGLGPYVALGVEYRPSPVWGGMMYVGYDDRHGKWDDVDNPCDTCTASLKTTLSYVSIEPSLRIAPFSNRFYVFLGPRVGINMAKTFTYKTTDRAGLQRQNVKDDWSAMRSTVVSGQVGAGYDIPLSSPHDPTQVDLSPFVSFHPYFGQDPRTVENWAVTTVRAGVILKLGRAAVAAPVAAPVAEGNVEFSVRSPLAVPVERRVRETFPLRDYVFFEEGSTEIPSQYVALTKEQAASFTEEQLQEVQPKNMTGRSLRQMTVYHNILNILGDRMKRSPGTTITLSGASEQGPEHGKARAESIKRYLVDVFGINGTRITTEGRDKPRIPSEQPGGTKELALLRAGDRRVDIESNSPELLIQVGGGPHYMLKPVQIVAVVEDPLDSHVFFNVVGANEVLTSWSLEIKDDQGKVQHFGPFTRERETIPGSTLLAGRPQGDYAVVMVGQTKGGNVLRKESSFHLVRRAEPKAEAVRFSILFDFDQSKTVASYDKFLTDMVTPLIPDSSTVVIHGHTDVIGEEDHNLKLSNDRAQDAQSILERALSSAGKRHVTFETFGFGEDVAYAPFENGSPEERFYNRTVIIDIVPAVK
jgi:outer membrane protein OmpA-like peptidoglycan-associated protein